MVISHHLLGKARPNPATGVVVETGPEQKQKP
jgi:hypothetical protein